MRRNPGTGTVADPMAPRSAGNGGQVQLSSVPRDVAWDPLRRFLAAHQVPGREWVDPADGSSLCGIVSNITLASFDVTVYDKIGGSLITDTLVDIHWIAVDST